jgi:drug/metabolite transporter (DMT)-like permease
LAGSLAHAFSHSRDTCAGVRDSAFSIVTMPRLRADPAKGFLYALGGTALVSTNFVTAKYGLKGFNPETFSLVWTTAAALYSLVVVLLSRQWPSVVRARSAAWSLALLGASTGAGMIFAWSGLARLDPSFAAFLWRFHPAFTIVLSVLVLHERLMSRELLPIALMILGGALSTVGRWNVVGVGTALTLLGCLAAAVQMLVAKARIRDVEPNVLVFYRVAIGAAVIAVWVLLTGRVDFRVAAPYWCVTALGAFLGPCASFLLTFRSYRYWDLSRASIVRTVQPLFVMPLAYVVFRKLPDVRGVLGGCVILGGALWLGLIRFLLRGTLAREAPRPVEFSSPS